MTWLRPMLLLAVGWIAAWAVVGACSFLVGRYDGGSIVSDVALGTGRSALLAVVVATASGVLGGGLGLAASLRVPGADPLVCRLVELAAALPSVLLVALCEAIFGHRQGLTLLLVLVSLRSIELARVASQEGRRIAGERWVGAALALGAGPVRIARHHLLPALAPVFATSFALSVAWVCATDAAITYLGLGGEGPSLGATLAAALNSGSWDSFLAAATALAGTLLAALFLAAQVEPHPRLAAPSACAPSERG